MRSCTYTQTSCNCFQDKLTTKKVFNKNIEYLMQAKLVVGDITNLKT